MSAVWEKRARFYDLFEGSDLRRGRAKADLFRRMEGRVLFVAVGTGLDVKHFPPNLEIVAIDISDEMLRRAAPRCRRYAGNLRLVQGDALNLCFPDDSFDTVVTSCTMCSVPNPGRALEEIHRVLRPGGKLLMFEHMRSRNPILGFALDLMTLWTRRGGTEMNRRTLETVSAANFRITKVESVFLDIILAIHARKDNYR
jgi:ubiquinone/menaquinone biosynthesis C-methylase UbiE